MASSTLTSTSSSSSSSSASSSAMASLPSASTFSSAEDFISILTDGHRYFKSALSTGYRIRCSFYRKPHTNPLARKTNAMAAGCKAYFILLARDGHFVLGGQSSSHNHAPPDPPKLLPEQAQHIVERLGGELSQDVILEAARLISNDMSIELGDVRKHMRKKNMLADIANDAQTFLSKLEAKSLLSELIVKKQIISGRLANLAWITQKQLNIAARHPTVWSMDSTFNVTRYESKLVLVATLTNEKTWIPICQAILETETAQDYDWLLNFIHFCCHRTPDLLITDMGSGQLLSLSRLTSWQQTTHRFCSWHVFKRLEKKFRVFSKSSKISFGKQSLRQAKSNLKMCGQLKLQRSWNLFPLINKMFILRSFKLWKSSCNAAAVRFLKVLRQL